MREAAAKAVRMAATAFTFSIRAISLESSKPFSPGPKQTPALAKTRSKGAFS
jgi:hypothetical protein